MEVVVVERRDRWYKDEHGGSGEGVESGEDVRSAVCSGEVAIGLAVVKWSTCIRA